MSVFVTDATRLVELCEQTLAAQDARHRNGWRAKKVVLVFRGIYLAQRAAYAMTYRDAEFDAPAVEFPTEAPPELILKRPDLDRLHNELRMLRYNTVDQSGGSWLPEQLDVMLTELITETADKAANFRHA